MGPADAVAGHPGSSNVRPAPARRAMNGNRVLYSILFVLLLAFWFLAYKTQGDTETIGRHSVLLGSLMIFVLRLSDMTLDTLRVIFTARNRKFLAAFAGFMQAAIYVVAIARVLKDIQSGPKAPLILGYAGGYAAGIVIGIYIEEHLALGFLHLQIISQTLGVVIADALRAAGHAATLMTGLGKEGQVSMIYCTVRRSDESSVRELITGIDPGAFITGEDVRSLARGHFRH